MKNKLIALFLVVFAAFSFTSAANAQARGGHFGGNPGFYHGGGNVYHGGGRVIINNNHYYSGGYRGGYRDYGYRGGYRDYGYRGYRGYGYRDYGYRGYNGFAWGLGLGYLLAPRYYNPPVYVAPAPQYYVDQYGREYYIDQNGYAVYTGR